MVRVVDYLSYQATDSYTSPTGNRKWESLNRSNLFPVKSVVPMKRRRIMPGLGLIALITSLAAVFALAVPALAQSAPDAKTWKLPRTADGHADLEGVWNNNTATPFERPSASADKAVFLPSEVTAYDPKTGSA